METLAIKENSIERNVVHNKEKKIMEEINCKSPLFFEKMERLVEFENARLDEFLKVRQSIGQLADLYTKISAAKEKVKSAYAKAGEKNRNGDRALAAECFWKAGDENRSRECVQEIANESVKEKKWFFAAKDWEKFKGKEGLEKAKEYYKKEAQSAVEEIEKRKDFPVTGHDLYFIAGYWEMAGDVLKAKKYYELAAMKMEAANPPESSYLIEGGDYWERAGNKKRAELCYGKAAEIIIGITPEKLIKEGEKQEKIKHKRKSVREKIIKKKIGGFSNVIEGISSRRSRLIHFAARYFAKAGRGDEAIKYYGEVMAVSAIHCYNDSAGDIWKEAAEMTGHVIGEPKNNFASILELGEEKNFSEISFDDKNESLSKIEEELKKEKVFLIENFGEWKKRVSEAAVTGDFSFTQELYLKEAKSARSKKNWFKVAEICEKVGDNDSAEIYYKKAVEKFDFDWHLKEMNGDYDAAKKSFRNFVGDFHTWDFAGNIYLKLGDKDKALWCYKHYIKKDIEKCIFNGTKEAKEKQVYLEVELKMVNYLMEARNLKAEVEKEMIKN